ncbi:hypothetical protein DFP72DRAFT_1064156 [Ephemerocybe angulata]|uniref:Uncharacterized protein n=1 Tax=Ephemerocybe angulata TaxID=980116 RepID=A0A8H6I7C7_9AGAR|nr:hypothetical protein DFP72DRAFT_1064156 [Tulosesus angulatus]
MLSFVIVTLPVEPRRSNVALHLMLTHEDLSTGENGEIAQDALAVIAEPKRLDGGNLELATELVKDAGGEGFAVNVLSDDGEGASGLGCEGGEDVLEEGVLLFREEGAFRTRPSAP